MKEHMYEAMYRIEDSHWWFRAKREIILSLIALNKNQTLIDFGCGTGKTLEELCKICDATGLDSSEQALNFCKKRVDVKLLKASLSEELPFDSTYDIGVALDVLEHLDDDFKALRSMKNVLNHGGRLIITVPSFMFMWSSHDDNCDHKRRYRKKELEALIEKSELETEYISYYNFWLFPFIALTRCVCKLLNIDKNSELENYNNKFINALLYRVFRSEGFFLRNHIKLPFGVSLIAVLRRRSE